MYAIIATGGKQYRVEIGSEVDVELLSADVGDTVKIPTVAVFRDKDIRTDKGIVSAKVLEHGKGEKIDIFKYKPKKNVRRRQGHRQPYTRIKIVSVSI